MTNHENFNEKANFDNVFLRCVILGFLGFLKEKFSWINYSEEKGEYKVNLPIHYSLTGDSRYIMDAFYDDVPQDRVNMNTDQIPRGVITLKSWAVKADEFTNPNIWFNINKEVDDELIQYVTQTKAVPVKLTFSLDTILDSEIDVFKCWQTYMENMWIYRYFTFDYNKVPIHANFNFISDTENSIVRDFQFGDQSVLKTSYDFEVHTFFPIFDMDHKMNANNIPNWVLQIWQNPSNPASVPVTTRSII